MAIGKDKAELINANAMRTAQQSLFTLPVGSKGRLKNREFYVMGAVRYAETDAQETFDNLFNGTNRVLTPEGQWSEYLLYNPTQGFLWLVESDDGWSLSQTQNTWPRLDRNRQPQGCGKLYDYGSRVEVTAGAFYWRIRSGDLNYYSDYRDGQNRKLSAELNTHEMAWSKSVPVDYSEIAEAFSLRSRAPHYTAKMAADGIDKSLRIVMTAILVVVNLPALMMDGNSAGPFVIIIGTWLLWTMGKEDGDED